MRCVWAVLVTLALAACILPTKGGSNRDAGAADAGSADAALAPDAQGVGIGCVTDATGIIWCRGVAQCPDVLVSPDLFPNCGFRARTSGLDLACWCTPGYVCPMGQPLSCDDARRLLDQQTEMGVCVQVAEGRCTQQASAAGKPPGRPATCDQDCYRACGPTAGCKQVCGC